jgi:two-component system NtrC family response regulator
MKIAIVEDDINLRRALEIAFSEKKEYEVAAFKNAKDALKKLDESFELVITDLTMPGMDGLELLKELGGKYESIVITGNATLNKAIEAMRLGAKDFLTKPFETETLIEAIERVRKVQRITAAAGGTTKSPKKPDEAEEMEFFSAMSPALEQPKKMALKSARTDAAVMLLGESGVGKEVFAGFIHMNSPRAKGPFVPINMAALPESLVESELFGFEKGAFTDAQAAKAGRFEEADGGTLFLDEIAEMPYGLQAKLLRAIQERKIRRLGGSKDITIDVRIIAATNQDIHASIQEKRFREDLYYRLNTIEIPIPPLRERSEEILPIANAVLMQNCEKYGLPARQFSQEAKQQLLSYRWPGNIRELISVCERAAILSEGEEVSGADLFLQSREGRKNVANIEKDLLTEALEQSESDRAKAAALLSMTLEDFESRAKKYNL